MRIRIPVLSCLVMSVGLGLADERRTSRDAVRKHTDRHTDPPGHPCEVIDEAISRP